MIAKTINVRLPEALYNQSEALAHDVPSESWQIRDIQKGIKEAGAGEFAHALDQFQPGDLRP